MTDSEKIAHIVEWMGGWPKHDLHSERCPRCLIPVFGDDEECYDFNPFTRIEDVMLVVERLIEQTRAFVTTTSYAGMNRCRISIGGKSEIANDSVLSRAITEAAWQVIEQLSQT